MSTDSRVYLALGDTVAGDLPASGDYLDLNSAAATGVPGFWIPGASISLPGGTVPAGINRGVMERGINPQTTLANAMGNTGLTVSTPPPPGTKPIVIGLTVTALGWNENVLLAYLAQLNTKLVQAEHASGAYGQGSLVYLWDRPGGATDYVFWAVARGFWQAIYNGLPDGNLYQFGVLLLYVYPYARTAPIIDPTSVIINSGGIVPGNYSWTFRKAIPGDVPALRQTRLTDLSAGGAGATINRITLARRSLRSQGALDFTPLQSLTPTGAGAPFVDATSIDGVAARGTLTGGWQTLGSTTKPSAGANQTGLYDVLLRVRDAAGILGLPGLATAGTSTSGGTLADGTWAFALTSYDANKRQSAATATVLQTMPVLQNGVVTFFDNFNTGDSSLWDGVADLNLANEVNPTSDAFGAGHGYATPGDTSTEYGYQTTLTNNATSTVAHWLYKLPTGGNDIGAMRVRCQINSMADKSCIPLYTLSTTSAPYAYFQWNNSLVHWDLIINGVSSTNVAIPTTANIWFTYEVVATYSAGSLTVTVYINDTLASAGTSTQTQSANHKFVLGAYNAAVSVASSKFTYTNVQLGATRIGASTGSFALSWPAASAGQSGYYLYFRDPSGNNSTGQWYKRDVGNVTSYSLTTTGSFNEKGSYPIVPGKPDVASAVRLRTGLVSTAVLTPHPVEAYTAVGNSLWEYLLFAGVQLPPEATQQGQSAPGWYLEAQARSRSNQNVTFDVDGVYLLPHDPLESTCVLEYPGGTLTTPAIWQLDTRFDGRVSCSLYQVSSPTTLLGQAECLGSWTGGPGDELAVVVLETTQADGQFQSTNSLSCTLQDTFRPRYLLTPGVAAGALTVSGNEITDDTRWRLTAGDGRAYPDGSVGIWPATTNLVTNGGFELDATLWTRSSAAGAITTDTTHAFFGLQSGKVVGGSTGGVFYNQASVSAGATYTVSAWVWCAVAAVAQVQILDVTTSVVTGSAFHPGDSQWHRLSATATMGGATSLARANIATVGNTKTAWFDGVQFESGSVATPYVDTSTQVATRAASRVQAPSGLFAAGQGWFAVAVRVEWPNGAAPADATLSDWRLDANNRLTLSYHNASQNWQLERLAASAGATATVAGGTFAASSVQVIIGQQTATGLQVWTGSTAGALSANTSVPTGLPATVDLGSVGGASNWLAGEVCWMAAGTGVLTAADRSTLAGLGTTDPSATQLSGAAVLSFRWTANSAQYSGVT